MAKGQASRQVEKGVELTVEPHMEGVTFSPERESFIWRGDWRRTLFRFSGGPRRRGRPAGLISTPSFREEAEEIVRKL